ncbi:allophanate hydrolase subunit 1 [Rhodococcus sp. NPDC127530]|uniref:5-oxoprolinase subunit B family protein n=1 Tax=unclassified Rhodococcus (in: high G+C Gram-positive bacteria) TaxID=192944 RepID=UPI00363F23AE
MLPSATPAITQIVYGDAAVMIEVSGSDLETRRAVTRALRKAVLTDTPRGVVDVVGGLESVLVRFDCAQVVHNDVSRDLDRLIGTIVHTEGDDTAARHFLVPTVFGGEHGPDLALVAGELGLTEDELVDLFTSASMTVDVLGSGIAPMMHGATFPGSVARCRTPRANVAAGAVMVAGHNAIIGPAPGPSGWRILGRTPLALFDIHRDPVVHYAPGDIFRFRAVSESEWSMLAGRPLEPVGALTS